MRYISVSSSESNTSSAKRNVAIPAAGDGERFKAAGYEVPKPFIPINGKCMIEHVIDNVARPQDNVILICRSEHALHIPESIMARPNVLFKFLPHRTEGTACTLLSVRQWIDNDDELIIANADQYVDYDRNEFEQNCASFEAVIQTFQADHPKWSYARVNEGGIKVVEVAEKRVISEHATTGVYYFRRGSDFCLGADVMIGKDIRVNGEFYTCPVFNELVDTRIVGISPCRHMYGFGLPADLEANRHVLEF